MPDPEDPRPQVVCLDCGGYGRVARGKGLAGPAPRRVFGETRVAAPATLLLRVPCLACAGKGFLPIR